MLLCDSGVIEVRTAITTVIYCYWSCDLLPAHGHIGAVYFKLWCITVDLIFVSLSEILLCVLSLPLMISLRNFDNPDSLKIKPRLSVGSE